MNIYIYVYLYLYIDVYVSNIEYTHTFNTQFVPPVMKELIPAWMVESALVNAVIPRKRNIKTIIIRAVDMMSVTTIS